MKKRNETKLVIGLFVALAAGMGIIYLREEAANAAAEAAMSSFLDPNPSSAVVVR